MVATLSIPCEYCHAPAGEPCFNRVSGKPMKKVEAHPCRVCAAHPELKQEAKPEEEWWQR